MHSGLKCMKKQLVVCLFRSYPAYTNRWALQDIRGKHKMGICVYQTVKLLAVTAV